MNVMKTGEPTVSEIERKMSQGIACHFYEDGDYRFKWFTAVQFATNDDDLFDVDAFQVVKDYVPGYRDMLQMLRSEPGEPRQVGFEIYWEGRLIHQEFIEEYEPVPLPTEAPSA